MPKGVGYADERDLIGGWMMHPPGVAPAGVGGPPSTGAKCMDLTNFNKG
jgi:hypothetical protein